MAGPWPRGCGIDRSAAWAASRMPSDAPDQVTIPSLQFTYRHPVDALSFRWASFDEVHSFTQLHILSGFRVDRNDFSISSLIRPFGSTHVSTKKLPQYLSLVADLSASLELTKFMERLEHGVPECSRLTCLNHYILR